MKVKILYLYHDIMNLYGENGNLRMIERCLTQKGAEVWVDRKTVTDKDIDFTKYDFIYCGAGTERSRDFCLEHLRGFSESLKTAFLGDKVMLFTGNSYEMLGKSLVTFEGKEVSGLGLFDFTVKEQDRVRTSGDVTLKWAENETPLIGYINKCSTTRGIENPLFEITSVVGTVKDTVDGIREKNFFGTQVIGPIAVKNPLFCDYICDLIMSE